MFEILAAAEFPTVVLVVLGMLAVAVAAVVLVVLAIIFGNIMEAIFNLCGSTQTFTHQREVGKLEIQFHYDTANTSKKSYGCSYTYEGYLLKDGTAYDVTTEANIKRVLKTICSDGFLVADGTNKYVLLNSIRNTTVKKSRCFIEVN